MDNSGKNLLFIGILCVAISGAMSLVFYHNSIESEGMKDWKQKREIARIEKEKEDKKLGNPVIGQPLRGWQLLGP